MRKHCLENASTELGLNHQLRLSGIRGNRRGIYGVCMLSRSWQRFARRMAHLKEMESYKEKVSVFTSLLTGVEEIVYGSRRE